MKLTSKINPFSFNRYPDPDKLQTTNQSPSALVSNLGKCSRNNHREHDGRLSVDLHD